jgi:hypothetical protein
MRSKKWAARAAIWVTLALAVSAPTALGASQAGAASPAGHHVHPDCCFWRA